MAYAGDLRPTEAWDLLEAERDALLVDVRCQPEWSFVGIPDLRSLGKEPILLSWQVYPTMQMNPDFLAELRKRVSSPDTPLLFICRSGARSRSAAMAMTAEGFRRCYNVAEGFEGHHDANGHRGCAGGWKATGLPWLQD